MATMLKHIHTGDVYPMNSDLARRHDMEQFIPVDEQFAEAAEEAAPKKRATGSRKAKPAPKAKPRAKAKPAPKAAAPVAEVEEPTIGETLDDAGELDITDLDLSDLDDDLE